MTFYKYTLFDGLIRSTRRYFFELCSILCSSCVENTSNEENVRSCYIWNHRINDLLSHYYFTILILDCEIYRTALSVHRIDHVRSSRKTRTTRMKPFKSSMWPTKISVARKSSVLYKSSLKNAKKKIKIWIVPWDYFVALYFCPVLQCNTVYCRGIFCARPQERIWWIDAVME